MARILCIVFNDVARDPRVSRQIDWMADEHQVTCAGLAPSGRSDVEFTRIEFDLGGKFAKAVRGLKLLARRNENVYWTTYGSAYETLQDHLADLIVANDLDTLPLAVRLAEKCGARLLYDAHEYAPLEFDESWRWRVFRGPYATELTRRYAPRADAIATVGQALADEFQKLIGVRPEVITNAPPYHANLHPTPLAEDGSIRLVHHGAAIPSRKLENLLRIIPLLDSRFEMNFHLMENDPGYVARLRDAARDQPRTRFREPVPMRHLPEYLNQYDLGLFFLEPNNFNNRNALPNKFFEFIQARLGVAIGPTPEMARIVRETGAGIVSEDFRPESLARKLNALTSADVSRFKAASQAAAREYSAESNRERWLSIVRRLLNDRP